MSPNEGGHLSSEPQTPRTQNPRMAAALAGALSTAAALFANAGCEPARDPATAKEATEAMEGSFVIGGKTKAIELDVEKMKGSVGEDSEQNCAKLILEASKLEYGVDNNDKPLPAHKIETIEGLKHEHVNRQIRAMIEKYCYKAAGGVEPAASASPSASASAGPAPSATPEASATAVPSSAPAPVGTLDPNCPPWKDECKSPKAKTKKK